MNGDGNESGGEVDDPQRDDGSGSSFRQPRREVLDQDFVYEALAHPRRRYVVYLLFASERWTLSELAAELAARESDGPETGVSDGMVAEVYTSLYHVHVPRLVELDVVEFEDAGSEETIVAAENAARVLRALEGMAASLAADREPRGGAGTTGSDSDRE